MARETPVPGNLLEAGGTYGENAIIGSPNQANALVTAGNPTGNADSTASLREHRHQGPAALSAAVTDYLPGLGPAVNRAARTGTTMQKIIEMRDAKESVPA